MTEAGACSRHVYWWGGEYEGDCVLPLGHRGDHYDGLSWYDDEGVCTDHDHEGATVTDDEAADPGGIGVVRGSASQWLLTQLRQAATREARTAAMPPEQRACTEKTDAEREAVDARKARAVTPT